MKKNNNIQQVMKSSGCGYQGAYTRMTDFFEGKITLQQLLSPVRKKGYPWEESTDENWKGAEGEI